MFNTARLENLHTMLTYSFTNKGSDSLYEYLYKCIKNDILLGNLDVDEKLPSKRSFAKNLGISVITVENAYEQLMAEGYIYSIPKKGFYVADLRELNLTKDSSTAPDTTSLSLEEKVSYLADFTSNQTDSEIFPFTIWARTMRELLNENQQQLMENPPCGGIMVLRQAISDYLHAFRGMVVNPQQIIVGAGTEYLYGLLIQLLGDDKIYGIENPGYPKIAKIYDSMHVSYSAIDLDEHGVCIDSLEDHQIDIMHLSPSHHFPTGIITPISRRYELLGWASKDENRYIIEDDYDSELRLGGKPIPTQTGGVGELSNFILGVCFVLPAGLIYKRKKTQKSAMIGALAGAVLMSVISVFSNHFVVYPVYTNFMPMQAILGAYQAINKNVKTLWDALIWFNMPFTFIKGMCSVVITFFIYKKISPILKGTNR